MDVQPLIPTPFRPRRGNPRYPSFMHRHFIIANPTSGRGTGARMIPVIERLMDNHRLQYTLVRTCSPGMPRIWLTRRLRKVTKRWSRRVEMGR